MDAQDGMPWQRQPWHLRPRRPDLPDARWVRRRSTHVGGHVPARRDQGRGPNARAIGRRWTARAPGDQRIRHGYRRMRRRGHGPGFDVVGSRSDVGGITFGALRVVRRRWVPGCVGGRLPHFVEHPWASQTSVGDGPSGWPTRSGGLGNRPIPGWVFDVSRETSPTLGERLHRPSAVQRTATWAPAFGRRRIGSTPPARTTRRSAVPQVGRGSLRTGRQWGKATQGSGRTIPAPAAPQRVHRSVEDIPSRHRHIGSHVPPQVRPLSDAVASDAVDIA